MVKLSTLSTIIQASQRLDAIRPNTGNVTAAKSKLHSMNNEQLGELLRTIDELVLNCKLLQHETVEVNKHA